MKIAYCLQGISFSGGTERTIISKANYLVSQGFEVYIITTEDKDRQPAFPLDERVEHYDLGLNFFEHWGDSLPKKIYYHFRNDFKFKHSLMALLKKINPDVVISTFCREVFPLSQYKGCKIAEYHYSRFAFEKSRRRTGIRLYDEWQYRSLLKAIKRYDRLVVLTHEDAEHWKEFNNVVVIPNAKTFECKQTASLNSPIVLAVGRLTQQKGFDKLIQAWSLVCKKIEGWTLHIVGDGELRDELQKQIDAYGLQSSAFLDGIDKNMEKRYINSSVFVMSSIYEGLPMVLLEAMGYGIPTVSFACPCGPRDLIVDGENGYLVSEGNIEELADRLIFLMSNSQKRKEMGLKAYLRSNDFSKEKIMRQWIDLFEGLCHVRK